MTPTILDEWAAAWRVPAVALHDLRNRLLPAQADPGPLLHGASEAAVSQQVRLEAGEKRVILMRNNVGATEIDGGRWIRYGLLNDSSKMNERYKSSDFVGIRPVHITAQHVGQTIGQFVAVEVKHAGWRYTGTDREAAQRNFLDLVKSRGGWGEFVSGRGML